MKTIKEFVCYNSKKCPIVLILNSTIFAENIIQKNYENLFGDCAKKIRLITFFLEKNKSFSLKGFSEKAIEIALKKISEIEPKFKSIPKEIVTAKITELKMMSNGDLKNSLNSFYLFSLGQQINENISKDTKTKNKSKNRNKIENKALQAESKNCLSKL